MMLVYANYLSMLLRYFLYHRLYYACMYLMCGFILYKYILIVIKQISNTFYYQYILKNCTFVFTFLSRQNETIRYELMVAHRLF